MGWPGFDLYRRVPKDLTKGSVPGAIVSLACITIVALLIGWEAYVITSPAPPPSPA
jgi:hypothetical protein